LKLNLGCGQNKLPGHINVDREAALQPDEVVDLEAFPWPWPDGSVTKVVLNHALEHLGADTQVFIGIMKELYRICAPGARVCINVPHPRHDHFLGDPTHVRVITPRVLSLFSKANCAAWAKAGAANTPLALYAGVDFEIVSARMVPDAHWLEKLNRGEITERDIDEAERSQNNVCTEIRMVLAAIKPSVALQAYPAAAPVKALVSA
jgi:hypothetical protein